MELFLLKRIAELFCTLGAAFGHLRLQRIGADLWDFVQKEYRPVIATPPINTAASKITRAVGWNTVSEEILELPKDKIDAIAAHEQRLDEILSSELFNDIMHRAAAIDPEVGDAKEKRPVFLAPYADPRVRFYRRLRDLIPVGAIDTIICVPWIRVGGADLVACLLAGALKKTRPNERVVILRLDYSNLERKEWIPEGVDTPDLSTLLGAISEEQVELLLYVLFMGVNPKRIINVNSRRCWKTFQRFGSRLTAQMPLYAYLFCWDQTASGMRVGYPTEFFPTTAPFLDGVFMDTRYLREELIRIYQPPAPLRERMVVLRSPARSEPSLQISIEAAVKTAARRPRPKVLWAGRLDRQKRFDLVIDIARRTPDVEFACWGEALLDPPPDRTALPSNLRLKKNFVSYDELPLVDSDCWLFTSDWEGMPTLLIELAMRGVAVIATAVGGVPELVDETTGWPVPLGSGVDVYIRVLRTALANPAERVERARRLQRRAEQDYAQSGYESQVEAALRKAEENGRLKATESDTIVGHNR